MIIYIGYSCCCRYYAVELEQHIYIEEDPHKSCRDYAARKETYEDCDLAFIESQLRQNYPPEFMPIWATANMSAVTRLYVNTSEEFTDKFLNILTGTQNSGTQSPASGSNIRSHILIPQTAYSPVWRQPSRRFSSTRSPLSGVTAGLISRSPPQ